VSDILSRYSKLLHLKEQKASQSFCELWRSVAYSKDLEESMDQFMWQLLLYPRRCFLRPLSSIVRDFDHLYYDNEEFNQAAFEKRREGIVTCLEELISLLRQDIKVGDAKVRATHILNVLSAILTNTSVSHTSIPLLDDHPKFDYIPVIDATFRVQLQAIP
jgi:hypothetical protein